VRFPPLKQGTFSSRINRFCSRIYVDGAPAYAHVPNSGRMKELFVQGAQCFLSSRDSHRRKTPYDLILVDSYSDELTLPTHQISQASDVEQNRHLVCVDSRIAPSLVVEALNEGRLEIFGDLRFYRKEVTYMDSRLDLEFCGNSVRCLVEVKSVSLVRDGISYFPDAPTQRGRRHLQTLVSAVRNGYRCMIIFVILRADAKDWCPNDESDPLFGEELRRAIKFGVEVYAYNCRITQREILLAERVPIHL